MYERLQRKGNTPLLLVEGKLVWSLWKAVLQFLRKFGINLPQDPATPLTGIYPKHTQSHYKDIFSTMFMAVLFVISKTWKLPRCTSPEYWIKKMWYICTIDYYSKVKQNKTKQKPNCILKCAGKWMELEKTTLGEVTRTQKDKHCMYSLISEFST